MCGLSGIYRDFVSQQNFPTDSLSEESEFCISLTTTKCKIQVKPVRELVGFVNINKIPKHIVEKSVFDSVHWFGMNYCTECGVIDTYCSCYYEPQSGTPHDKMLSVANSNKKVQNVTFDDGEEEDPYMVEIDSIVDPLRHLQDTDDASLGNFFSRPIKVFEQDWTTSGSFLFSFDPWTAFWESTRVENRLANFKLLRCKMHIKVLINGNAFHYGRLMISYSPFATWDQFSRNITEPTNAVQNSQLPKLLLDPCTSQGGEMELPFFSHANYIDIPTKQWNRMGNLEGYAINPLKHANGAVDIVSVSIFAWAEDVSLSVLTSNNSALTPQSGEEVDEANATGVISGPATTVARAAAYFTKIPYIGPYAMATSMAAKTTAAIAKMFGYSRATMTKAPEPFRPTPVSSLALTNVPDVSQKMTVDHKQELSIDPRLSGTGGLDPMNIREIAKRETWLTKFSWNVGTTPETLLWNGRVSPVTWNESGDPLAPAYHFPACAFAALPFRYWTGTMKFRFQVVASAYHKGRLKFVYDPDFIASNEYNTNYLKIVDISEESDFTLEIGVAQANPLINHHSPGADSNTQLYSTTPYTSKEEGNGVIGVYVVNELTVPNTTVNNDIEINVFVSMGDDFEVFVPDDQFQNFIFFEPQSGEVNAPELESSTVLGMNSEYSPDMTKVWIGESIASFRTMLKRYSVWNCVSDEGSRSVLTGRFNRFPYYRGSYSGAADITFAGDPYSYCNTTLMHWVRAAHLGSRGSVRYKFVPRGLIGTQITHMSAAIATQGGDTYSFVDVPFVSDTLVSARKRIVYLKTGGNLPPSQTLLGTTGAALTIGSVNPILEFEVPFYSNVRFEPGRVLSYTSNWFSTAFNYRIETGATQVAGSAIVDIHVAAGEDFQVYFFAGLPKCYYEPVAPA